MQTKLPPTPLYSKKKTLESWDTNINNNETNKDLLLLKDSVA